jgi:hypothetical protein
MTALAGVIPRPNVRFGRLARWEPFFGQVDHRSPLASLIGSHAQTGRVVTKDTDAIQHHGFQIQLGHWNLRQSLIRGSAGMKAAAPAREKLAALQTPFTWIRILSTTKSDNSTTIQVRKKIKKSQGDFGPSPGLQSILRNKSRNRSPQCACGRLIGRNLR